MAELLKILQQIEHSLDGVREYLHQQDRTIRNDTDYVFAVRESIQHLQDELVTHKAKQQELEDAGASSEDLHLNKCEQLANMLNQNAVMDLFDRSLSKTKHDEA